MIAAQCLHQAERHRGQSHVVRDGSEKDCLARPVHVRRSPSPVPAEPRQTFFLAAVSDDVGLTSMALGLVQALRRDHVTVGFVKPILQPASRGTADLATFFARSVLHLDAPEPINYADAEACVRSGGLNSLM